MQHGLLAAAILLLLFLGTAGCLKEGSVDVSGITIARESVTSGEVVLNVSCSIVHYSGPGIGATKLRLQALDTATGLLANEVTQSVGPVDIGKTRICHTLLPLPRSGSYRIIVSIFDGDHLLTRGEIPVYNLERLPTDSSRTALTITDMDFIVRGVSGGMALIEANIYCTNRGREPSPDLNIEVKAREEDARLTADRQWTSVNPVPPDKTVIANVTLTIPDQYNYEVPVVLWRDGVTVGESTGYIRLRPVTTAAKEQQFITREIETGSFTAKDQSLPSGAYAGVAPTMRSPGFGLPTVFCTVVILALLARRRYHECD